MASSHDELAALADKYVAGTLPPETLAAFEEHYFDCRQCGQRVRRLQVLQRGLLARPQASSATEQPRLNLFHFLGLAGWRVALAAAATLVIVAGAVWMYRAAAPPGNSEARRSAPSQPVSQPATAEVPTITTLAELELPPYHPTQLRSVAGADKAFAKGMAAYQSGDCGAAAAQLKLVPDSSLYSEGAQFYRGACLLKVGDPAEASKSLQRVALSHSSYTEPANYYLAIAYHRLGRDDDARKLFHHVASKQGEYSDRARVELQNLHSY